MMHGECFTSLGIINYIVERKTSTTFQHRYVAQRYIVNFIF